MKQRRKSGHSNLSKSASGSAFVSPFRELKKLLQDREHSTKVSHNKTESTKQGVTVDAGLHHVIDPSNDAELFRQAVADARQLASRDPERMPASPGIKRATITAETSEVMAHLSELVSGVGDFDITQTEEYVEGARVGLDPRLVIRLRRGEFASQAHVDLHGLVQAAAKPVLSTFIRESIRKGRRCILVIHGKGRGSPGGQPVLKQATIRWLSHGELSAHVLAFTTARAADGGGGAMYVLLRRDRHRSPFSILNGTARRR